jgi:hypothetical protein
VRDGYSAERAADFFQKLLDRVKRLPSVTAACLTDTLPVVMDGNAGVLFSSGGKETERDLEWARRHMVGRDYFETAGIPILAGRGFRKEDEANGAAAVVVSEELVRKFWNGADPLGRQIDISNDEASGGFGALPGTIDNRSMVLGKGRRVFEVVGVAKDVAEDLVASKKRPFTFAAPGDYAQPLRA